MALATTFFALLLFISLSSAVPHYHVLRRTQLHYQHHNPFTTIINGAVVGPAVNATTNSSAIQQACKATRFPDQCFVSLTQYKKLPPDPNPLQILQSAMDISTQNVKAAQPMVQAILDASGSDKNRSEAARSCLEYLRNSETRGNSTAQALPRGKNKDARAWMGAILDYQYGCWNTFKYVNGTKQVNDAMSFLNTTIGLASNALSLLVAYDRFGNQTGSWGSPKTERDGFWELFGSGSGLDFAGGFPTGLQPDVTVCKKGGCAYETVQEAVEEAPSNAGDRRFVIWIKAGVYNETVRVPFDKKNVVFLGDGIGKTVITGSLTMPTTFTYNTATVGVLGDGFMAKDLTIENTAGPDTHQAVAFRSDSDLSIIENCEFLGNQDTLYAKSLRQYYKSCRIEGNIDFIFGNSAAFFQNCTILIRPRQMNPEQGENNAVTAHGRTDPAQSSGFVFQNCLINGTEEYMKLYNSNPKVHNNFLGRPWKEYSRTVFITCDMEALIAPEGWMPWDQDFALKTLYYGEFGNKGLGANLSKRVNWSSVIPPQHVNVFSVQNFIQGNEWIQASA